ncbi:CheR family methyltransferase [Pyruvatibacter mobilis]|uniref:CheR family methyltransferase n=1 Tax=Pyruvatibacter mobilis TaxID=1712261 RepID=UPI003BA9B4DE
MTPEEFDFLSGLVRKRSGLVLSNDKTYLLESRLTPIARKNNLGGISELVSALRMGSNEALAADVTEAMTTNESFFFRDKTPFDIFSDRILPHMMKTRAGQRKLRVWSAAASTGQEIYSLAMLIDNNPATTGWTFDLLGTDLSREVLERARQGMYTQFEVQRGLPIQLLMKYFTQVGETWQIDAKIRRMAQFKENNLLEPLSHMGRFDIIFCRNVLIYFDQPTKKMILERMADMMPDDGCLLLGAAETVVGITDAFKPVPGARGLYARKPEALGDGAAPAAAPLKAAVGAGAPAAPAGAGMGTTGLASRPATGATTGATTGTAPRPSFTPTRPTSTFNR